MNRGFVGTANAAMAAFAPADDGPLPRALSLARGLLTGLSVTVDARALGPVPTGTQVHALGLVRALAALEDVRVRVLLPSGIAARA